MSPARKDMVSGAVLLALAALYGGFAQRIQPSGLDDPVGARGLPNVLAILLGVVALLIMAKAALAKPKPAAEADPDDHRAPLARALGFILIGVGYIVLAPLLGYGPGLALLIAAVALYEGARPSPMLAAVAIGGGVVFWLLFVALLGVEQPTSPLFAFMLGR